MLSVSSQSLDRPLILGHPRTLASALYLTRVIIIVNCSRQIRTTNTMSSFPYVGLDEIKNDKIGTLKALFAEFIGTGILVKFEIFLNIMFGPLKVSRVVFLFFVFRFNI